MMRRHSWVLGWFVWWLATTVGTLPVDAQEQDEAEPEIRVREWDPSPLEPTPVKTYQAATPTIEIGLEYAFVDSRRRAKKVAGLIAETGVRTVKVFPDQVTWGHMQRSARRDIRFGPMDRFVRIYQEAGFPNLILTLKSHSEWASKDCQRDGSCGNPTPKPKYLDLYGRWVQAVVERYDGDGRDDMPALRFPVRWIEIGARFSHDEPAPADEYVEMLRVAYRAAHAASAEAVVTHAGFHTTTVFAGGRRPDDLQKAFQEARRVIVHDLAAVRTVLDAHDAFDVVNVHSLGDPYEIEAMIPWLKDELADRGVDKPIIIGDSAPAPFVAWGPATSCTLLPEEMGIVIPPATEQDRCRLANYFQRLIDRERFTSAWTQRYVAGDLIKRVVLAAEQGVALINTAYIEDIHPMKEKAAQAKIGTAAWAGMIDLGDKERRPVFFAVERLRHHMAGYQSLRRLNTPNDQVRIYEFERARGPLWIAWVEPPELSLPGDPLVRLEIDLPVDASAVIVERMIDRPGQINPRQQLVRRSEGFVSFPISSSPTFVLTGY